MATTDSPSNISFGECHENARSIAYALTTHGGVACASVLKDATGLSSAQMVRYHVERLCETTPPLVERTGRTIDVGAPKESIEYRLTDAGERAVAAHTETDTGLPVDEEVAYLKTEVERLRSELDEAKERADEAHERIDRMNEYFQGRD